MGKERRSRKRTRDSDEESESSRRCRKKSRRRRSRRERRMRRRSTSTEDMSPELRRRETTVPVSRHEQSTTQPHQHISMTPPPASTFSANIDSNNFANVFKELVQAMRTDGNNERFPTINVVPEFDPCKRNQSVDMWITKVNECSVIYNWSERQVIHYALPKLVGLAQKWYQGLPSLLFSWDEWQDKLRVAFPSDENYGRLLTEMLACKARFGDSLEEYYYEKMVFLNRCNISGKNAIDCILFGIEDRSVRTSAEAVQFTEPDKLLVYLRNVRLTKRPEKPNTALQTGSSDSKRNKTSKESVDGKPHLNTKCYNCGEEGHPYFKCKQPIRKCDRCHKIGHLVGNCPSQKETLANKSVLNITQEQNNDRKYFKVARINGQPINCFIDFGSQSTLIRESDAQALSTVLSLSDLPILRGFGNSVVNCCGKCEVDIEIDSVKARVQALVVPDNLLQVPVLIGQTFTEQEHIIVYKTKSELIITGKIQTPKNLLLYTAESTTIAGFTEIPIKSIPVYDGNVVVEPSFCQLFQREYEVLPNIVRLSNGKGTLAIKALAKTGFTMDKDMLIVRALPLVEIKSSLINRVENSSKLETNRNIERGMVKISDNIDQGHVNKLIDLLNKYKDCFAFSIKELGCMTGTEMDLNLHDGTPVVYRPYRMPFSERIVVRDMVQELEDSGIVRPSTSSYASPVLLVKKKSGDYRLCIDYRSLNRKTVKEHYPIPRIDDQLDCLSGFKYYTTLDLASGYYQLPMSESSKHLTAFITPDGHYEFNRMPFGLVNAPANFQRAINNILGNARFKEAFAYMDDIIIPSKSIEEGFQSLKSTLDLFRTAGLTLKLAKCNFLMQSIDYLGFEVCEDGIRPGKTKIEAVEMFPQPTDQHKVRQFLGLASFFRRFIKGFSSIARPLTQLLKKDSKWKWSESEENAFMNLKRELVKRPILAFYNPSYETQLHTDASKTGIAGILLQRPKNDTPFSAVAYYSRQTSPEESRFTSYDLETLAVAASLQRFRNYLLGVPFTIVTDCNSLRATFAKKDVLPRVARWWNIMLEYDFNITYKPGVTMSHVDALSRNPVNLVNTEVKEVRYVDSNWIATVQQSDPELQRIVNILKDQEMDNVLELKNNFTVKRGLLYRKTDSGDRWVVPKGVRWQVLKSNHDDIGHYGFDKTYDKIKNTFWFAKMRRFIKKYVESCLECAHTKIPAGKRAGELHPIPKVDRPFHTLHIDHLGPFVRSKKKNSYLLIIIDAFTKYILLIPVKTTKTVHTISAIKTYFHTFGVPTRLISDRGTSFTSKRFQEYLHSLGVRHIRNAVATPRANGQVERYNRTILASLSATNYGKPEKLWDESVSEIQWGLNNTLNKGIGKTPAQALFGIKLVGTQNSLLNLNIVNDSDDNGNNLETIRTEVSQHIEKKQLEQKARFDKARKLVNFKVGDLVRVERDVPSIGKSRKLIPKIRGPYRIMEVFEHDRYRIEDTPLSRKGNKRFTGVFSVDKIHPWLVYNRNINSDSESESQSDLNK